jgi:hypothetical protein
LSKLAQRLLATGDDIVYHCGQTIAEVQIGAL